MQALTVSLTEKLKDLRFSWLLGKNYGFLMIVVGR
jgi:hypothetical protein